MRIDSHEGGIVRRQSEPQWPAIPNRAIPGTSTGRTIHAAAPQIAMPPKIIPSEVRPWPRNCQSIHRDAPAAAGTTAKPNPRKRKRRGGEGDQRIGRGGRQVQATVMTIELPTNHFIGRMRRPDRLQHATDEAAQHEANADGAVGGRSGPAWPIPIRPETTTACRRSGRHRQPPVANPLGEPGKCERDGNALRNSERAMPAQAVAAKHAEPAAKAEKPGSAPDERLDTPTQASGDEQPSEAPDIRSNMAAHQASDVHDGENAADRLAQIALLEEQPPRATAGKQYGKGGCQKGGPAIQPGDPRCRPESERQYRPPNGEGQLCSAMPIG